jgi:hypothetical protein
MKALLRACALALLLAAAPAGAAAPANADEVLKRYVDAMGGHEKLARIQSRRMEAKLSMGWISATLKSRIIHPNRFEEEASMLGMGMSSGYDGTTGWTRKGGKATVVQGKELTRMLRGHSLDWYRHFAAWYPTRKLLPDAQVDGVKVHVVEMVSDLGDRQVWRFDAATGLLKQMEATKQEDPKEPPVQVISTVADYREVDGILLAFKVTGTEGSKKFSLTVQSVQHNGPQEPIRFPAEKK